MDEQGSVTNWIGQVKDGDETAAATLWERYFQRLIRLCRKRLPDFAVSVAEECLLRLSGLADDQLRHIALRKLDGHTNDEIAAELHCSVRTIERRLRDIRDSWSVTAEEPADKGD